jgi:hypothetical protein
MANAAKYSNEEGKLWIWNISKNFPPNWESPPSLAHSLIGIHFREVFIIFNVIYAIGQGFFSWTFGWIYGIFVQNPVQLYVIFRSNVFVWPKWMNRP